MTTTVTCPQCGRVSSARARWCIGCRTPLSGAAAEGPLNESAPPPASDVPTGANAERPQCPLCGGAPAQGTLKLEAQGETTKQGIPFVFTISTTNVSMAELHGVCVPCRNHVTTGQMKAVLAAGIVGIALAGFARAAGTIVFAAPAALWFALNFKQLRYGFLDDMLWGGSLRTRLGLADPAWEAPTDSGALVMRASVLGMAGMIAMALVADLPR